MCFGARETLALSLDSRLRADEAACPMYAVASKRTKPGVGSEAQEGRRGRSQEAARRAPGKARAAGRGGHGATAERSTARAGQCRRRGGPTGVRDQRSEVELDRSSVNGRTAGSSFYLGWKKEPEKEETKWGKKMREISKQKPLVALDHAGQLSSVKRKHF